MRETGQDQGLRMGGGHHTFTFSSLLIGKLFVQNGTQWHYRIVKKTKAPVGTVKDTLDRFCDKGWISRRDEKVHAGNARQTPRVLYDLTEAGMSAFRAVLDPLQMEPQPAST